jgi:hypothetical protein
MLSFGLIAIRIEDTKGGCRMPGGAEGARVGRGDGLLILFQIQLEEDALVAGGPVAAIPMAPSLLLSLTVFVGLSSDLARRGSTIR